MKAEDVHQKPKPAEPAADGMYWRKCPKCRGTGVWAKGVLNGHLHSNTGFACWACDSTGWQRAYKPVRQKATTNNDFEIPF